MDPILDPQELKIWQIMPEEEKKRIFDTVYSILEGVARKQLEHVNQWKQITNDEKESAHIYVFGTVENFWENVKLAQYLGRENFSSFAHYPVRACMEMFLQFSHFCHQSEDKRNRIAIMELLRPSVRFYFREKREGGNGNKYKEFYNEHSKELGLPVNIDEADEEKIDHQLRSFPSARNLCDEYHAENPTAGKTLYFLYQYLCESVHGKIFSRFLRKQSVDFQEYRRGMMILYIFAKDILVLLDDKFLEQRFRTDVKTAVKEADAFIKNSVNFQHDV
ncbi:MAG: hypothetical protein UT82_C0012G0023 [Parcubacteria group bacterium GW2011_GWB1_40_14]|nr:MAG: hypothetical protein UT82_C0012G0023 [Parcubacteria group bacterium GW2011_GWB1_40_14]